MSKFFDINGTDINTRLEDFNRTSIYIFRKNQTNLDFQNLINIILDGNQKPLIAYLIKNLYQHFYFLKQNIIKNQPKQFNQHKNQLASQFYQYLSSIQIGLYKNQEKNKFMLQINSDNNLIYGDNVEISQEIQGNLYDTIEIIYENSFTKFRFSEHSLVQKLSEYFREVLIQKFKGYKINHRKQTSLKLQQNGDIIISRFNNQKTLTLSKSKIFHNQHPNFCKNQQLLYDQSPKQIVSEGFLDESFDQYGYTNIKFEGFFVYQGQMKYGLLNGEGIITNYYQQKLYQGNFVQNKKHGKGIIFYNQTFYEGSFNNDYMSGPFTKSFDNTYQIYYFYRNQQVEKQVYEQQNCFQIQSNNQVQSFSSDLKDEAITQSICSYQEFNITIQQYKSLSPGRWLFETQLDYFLDYLKNHFQICSRFSNEQTIIFNTSQSSDFINCDSNNQFHFNGKLYSQFMQGQKDKKRKVFVLNCQRCHFMIMIQDNNKLYCCDSLYCEKKNLENAFYDLLKLQDRNCYILKCTQQKNGYDCGIFALFYAIQFMKYDNLSMLELEQKLCLRNPSQFRWQLKQFVKYNHDYILTNF